MRGFGSGYSRKAGKGEETRKERNRERTCNLGKYPWNALPGARLTLLLGFRLQKPLLLGSDFGNRCPRGVFVAKLSLCHRFQSFPPPKKLQFSLRDFLFPAPAVMGIQGTIPGCFSQPGVFEVSTKFGMNSVPIPDFALDPAFPWEC